MNRFVLTVLLAAGFAGCRGGVAQQVSAANQTNALVTAARNDNSAVLRALIADGAPLDGQSERDGQTAVIAAIESDRIGALRFLLEHGARADAANRAGVVPLLAAVDAGNRAAILMLAAKGVDVEAPTVDGEGPLLRAATKNQPGAVAALLLVGAKVEAMDAAGRTALLAAACAPPANPKREEYKTDTVQILLDWNARLDVKTANGDTVQMCAARNQPAAVAEQMDAAAAERAALVKAEEKAKLWKAGDGAADLRFNLLLKAFGKNQDDDFVRGLIFAAAETLPKPRAVPAEALRVHDAAMTALASADEHDQIERPIAELRRAVELAPWWREAYRDLALAFEKNGQYEWASEQMALYLRSRPQGEEKSRALEMLIRIELEAEMIRRSLK
jgi:hypothetical protein